MNVTVRDAQVVMASLPPMRDKLENRMENVTDKLDLMRDATASLPLALNLVNQSSLVFSHSTRTIAHPAANEVSFDIKTYVTQSVVLFMVGEPLNETNTRSDRPVSYFSSQWGVI